MRNIINIGPNSIALESVNNIALVGHKTNTFEQKENYRGPTQKHLGFLGLSGKTLSASQYKGADSKPQPVHNLCTRGKVGRALCQ
jgi:hypothetical protein